MSFTPRSHHKPAQAALSAAVKGDRVLGGSKYTGAIGATAATAVVLALGGCSSFDTTNWFQKPPDLFGTRAGYTYSNLGDIKQQERPITANDLIDANGACPVVAPAPSPAPSPQPAANADGNAVNSADVAALLGGGVAIGMTECAVAQRLGRPGAINIGKNPNGLRGVVLTYNDGARPGIYRFEAGRLTEMDEIAPRPPPPEPADKKLANKKLAKKKPSKTPPPAKPNGST